VCGGEVWLARPRLHARSEARHSESGVWSCKSEKFGRRVDNLLSVLRLDLGLRSDHEGTNQNTLVRLRVVGKRIKFWLRARKWEKETKRRIHRIYEVARISLS
jgi:hypothetical protein